MDTYLSSAAKLHSLLQRADFIQRVGNLLSQVDDTKKNIDAPVGEVLEVEVQKLKPLRPVHDQQIVQLASLEAETEELLQSYDNLMYSLSKQFQAWSAELDSLEEAQNKGKRP